MMQDLFADRLPEIETQEEIAFDTSLGQWMTPAWAAQCIVDQYSFKAGDVVVDPASGTGRLIEALPTYVRGIGVEIDPRLAAIARKAGHEVITGDFAKVDLPVSQADMLLANPPYETDVIDAMLDRGHELLKDEGIFAMLVPAYLLQTSSRVCRYSMRWSLRQSMVPRNLFPGIRLPLCLVDFIKSSSPKLYGLLFYHESRAIEEMPSLYRETLVSQKHGWRKVVEQALQRMGGKASLQQIYAEVGPRRPTANPHWKEQVRKVLSTASFTRTEPSTYALA